MEAAAPQGAAAARADNVVLMVRLTPAQIEALIACVDICDAGEWPLEDVKRGVAQRAANKLRDLLLPVKSVAITLLDENG